MLGYNHSVKKNLPTTISRYAAALAVVLLITHFYRHTHRFNATTVAFTYLLAILGVSTIWGLAVSVFMSLAATLTYNYYFLPPIGAFIVADPQNWVPPHCFSRINKRYTTRESTSRSSMPTP